MPVRAQIEGGPALEFPDGTDPGVIQNAVKRYVAGDTGAANTMAAGAKAIAEKPLTPSRFAGLAVRGATPVAAGATAGAALGMLGGPATAAAGGLIGGAALPIADLGVGAANAVTGKNWTLPSQVLSRLMTAAGFPEPQNTTERMVEAGGAAVGGAGTGIPSAARLATTAASPVTRGVMQTMAARPAEQMMAQPAAAAASQFTAEKTGSPLAGAAAGMAAGGLVPMAGYPAARRLVTPLPNRLNPEQTRLAGAAQREGIDLTLGQRTGSRTMKLAEGVLADMPISADMTQGTADQQRSQFNRAVLGRAGVNAERADPDTLNRAFDAWGQEAQGALARTPPLLPDRQFAQGLTDSLNRYGMRLDQNIAPTYRSYYDQLMEVLRSGHSIPSQVYQNIRSDIGGDIRMSRDPKLRAALGSLQTALDGMVERQAPADVSQDWGDLRRRYSALMTVDDAMGGGTQEDRSGGNIPLGAFRSAVDRSDPYGFSRGRGQYNELARVADFLGSSRIPNSGTPGRQIMQSALTGGGLAAPIAAISHSPLQALAAVMGTVAGPPLAHAAINSRVGQAYLGNQLLAAPAQGWAQRRQTDLAAAMVGAARQSPQQLQLSSGK